MMISGHAIEVLQILPPQKSNEGQFQFFKNNMMVELMDWKCGKFYERRENFRFFSAVSTTVSLLNQIAAVATTSLMR